MSKDIDQRAQRHDPASRETRFPDEPTADNTKQPAGIAIANEGNDSVVSPTVSGKHNIRDDGHSKAVDDLPVRNIKDHASDDQE